MKRFAIAFPLLLVSGSAMAQTLAPEVNKDMWCGTALVQTFTTDPSPNPSPAQLAANQKYIDGGNALISRAVAAERRAGMTDQQISQSRSDFNDKVKAQLEGHAENAEFTFPECSDLAEAAQGTSSSPAAPAGGTAGKQL
jgi:hypothetical protein